MSAKKYPLTIESDTLNAFKSDFNQMLRRLLRMMESQEAEEGTLSAKITVKLAQDQARDYKANGYDGMRDIISPTFNHKVGISMQFKDEKSGSLSGNYEMVWDKDLNAYVMVEIDNGQTSMFDEEDSSVPVADAEVVQPADAGYEAGKAFVRGIADGMNEINGNSIETPALPPVEPKALPTVETPATDEDLACRVEDFEYVQKYVGKELKILENHDMYSVRTVKGNNILLTSVGVGNSAFRAPAEILAKHVGHKLMCCSNTVIHEDGLEVVTRVYVKCMDCDEEVWEMKNPNEGAYEYDKPES